MVQVIEKNNRHGTLRGSLTIHEGGTMRSPCGPKRHISDNLSILKQFSLLWYVDLHQEQERATISYLVTNVYLPSRVVEPRKRREEGAIREFV